MISKEVKSVAQRNGARICGIAPIERFSDAPKGFGPLDLFPKTQSVVAFAKQVPKGTLNLNCSIPYSVIEEVALHETHRIALELMLFLESNDYQAVIVPSEPYEYWDAVNRTGKGLISLKHLAYQCGLGTWGNNHLLYNPEIGSLMKIGAILTDAKLDADPIIETKICKPNCNLCFSNCPTGALTAEGVNQAKCRVFSHGTTTKGDAIYSCNNCRKVCPNVSGFTCI